MNAARRESKNTWTLRELDGFDVLIYYHDRGYDKFVYYFIAIVNKRHGMFAARSCRELISIIFPSARFPKEETWKLSYPR